MSVPVLEVAYLPMTAGIDLENGDKAAIWNTALETIAAQSGYRSLYWGFKIEEPETVQLSIEWDNIEAHHTFMSSPTYTPFLTNLGQLMTAHPTVFHIAIPSSTPFAAAASAPVTECISIYFSPTSLSKPAYDANIDKFREEGIDKTKDVTGFASGWVVEGQTHGDVENGEEGKAVMYGGFIGWPSVEAHMEFRKTEVFGKVIGYLREGAKGLKVHHVAFKKYVKA